MTGTPFKDEDARRDTTAKEDTLHRKMWTSIWATIGLLLLLGMGPFWAWGLGLVPDEMGWVGAVSGAVVAIFGLLIQGGYKDDLRRERQYCPRCVAAGRPGRDTIY